MKFSLFAILGVSSLALAQSIEPSPTESIGCEPHGDHWHCEGPRPTEAPVEENPEDPGPSPTNSVGCEPHGDHWHCDGPRPTEAPEPTETEAENPGPSPTDSVGCEPHGDHWHCDGPAVTTSAEPEITTSAAVTTSEHDDHDHDHTEGPGSSPTESVGCEPHGDHWHCEDPIVPSTYSTIVTSAPTPSGNNTIPTPVPTAGAAVLSAGVGAVALGLAAILAF